jgi:hypothetical protein
MVIMTMSCEGKPNPVTSVSDNKKYIFVGKVSVEMTGRWKFGRCLCCGGYITVHSGGNIIVVFCEIDEEHNFICKMSDIETCPGTELCPNKKSFSGEMQKEIIETIIAEASRLVDKFDNVFLLSTPETRIATVKYYVGSAFTTKQILVDDICYIQISVDRRKCKKQEKDNEKEESEKKA